MNPPPELYSPLADIELAFRYATRAPALLALDGAAVGTDLPPRQIPLDELRRLLLHGSTSYATKDRALGLVASRAQAGDDLWTVGFGGLLMPGLKRVARRLRQAPRVDRAEVGPEVVVALMEAIARIDPAAERIAARVCWDVYRRAARALGVRRPTAREAAWPTETLTGSALASTNPEEVIARAVRAGVITVDDAELIALTRIEGRRVTDVALSLALPPDRLQKRRVRAEARLAALLRLERAGEISDAHRARGTRPGTSPAAASTTALPGYRSRPGGRLAGLRLSPSDLARWSPAVGASAAHPLGVAAA
jgi:DNA-directed RNA polymerase specialized sigma24 family protein